MTIGQLIGHIWGLINWVSINVLGRGETRPQSYPDQRDHALHMLHQLRQHVSTLDDQALAAITIDGRPFWHLLNGPLADALTHVGQINVLRRLAGNPTPKAAVFTGEPPGAVKPPASRTRTVRQDYPILEYDPSPTAIVEPREAFEPVEGLPEHCVLCFFQNVIEQLAGEGLARELKSYPTASGMRRFYELDCGLDRPVTLVHPGVGAPLAAASLEVAIALGARKFIACGGAGVLDREIAVGHLVVPTAAIRDEGTSYHYLPAGREIAPAPSAVQAIETVLRRHNVDYLTAKTWTTDAVFRETREITALRRSEGCLTVEMEAATFFAVAQFRGVPLGQILYGGDNLDADKWDRRDWMNRASVRERLVFLAAEACLEIP